MLATLMVPQARLNLGCRNILISRAGYYVRVETKKVHTSFRAPVDWIDVVNTALPVAPWQTAFFTCQFSKVAIVRRHPYWAPYDRALRHGKDKCCSACSGTTPAS